MKLYFTPLSPYARMARIAVLEKNLSESVELIAARTREPDSPYYAINPSGRVPYLVLDEATGLEGSELICAYLDAVDGDPILGVPSGTDHLTFRRLEAQARSMLDGLSVWRREFYRPEADRSPTLFAHEAARGQRLAALWERDVDHACLQGALNMVQITLICALQMERLLPELDWRTGHPKLCTWEAKLAARASIAETAPSE